MILGTTNVDASDVPMGVDWWIILHYDSGIHEDGQQVRALMREWANIVATAVPLWQKGRKNAQQAALLDRLGSDLRYLWCVWDFRRIGAYIHSLEQYLAQPIEEDDWK